MTTLDPRQVQPDQMRPSLSTLALEIIPIPVAVAVLCLNLVIF